MANALNGTGRQSAACISSSKQPGSLRSLGNLYEPHDTLPLRTVSKANDFHGIATKYASNNFRGIAPKSAVNGFHGIEPKSAAEGFHGKAPKSARNDFNGIDQQFASFMSSSQESCYEVFINHHGQDVKNKLASTIYHTLDLMGVKPFLDREELKMGDFFPQAIQDGINSASVHVAIFSPRYAESPWCLQELSLMLQTKVPIIPVFYDVNPSDLRYVHLGKGIYADAFRQHKAKARYTPEKIREWEEALRCASYLDGCIWDADNCDEGKLLRKIVETVLFTMKKVPLEVATFPVGLDNAVQDLESEVGSSVGNNNVHIVGITGPGGCGKTTLAKELFNRKCSSFSRCCFISNVRSAASTDTLHDLQSTLLDELRIQHSAIHNIHQGRGMLSRYLRSKTVLIVLDDVADVEQIHTLLPFNLGPGSYIIVTTRDENVLKTCGVSSIYRMKLLDYFNAKQLFCRHAFLKPYSQLGFEHLVENSQKFQDLIERFVELSNGLPLDLKVYGAMVNGRSETDWEDQLTKLENRGAWLRRKAWLSQRRLDVRSCPIS